MISIKKMKFTWNINSTGILYQHYWKEVNVTWKGIKNLISLKTTSRYSPSIYCNNKTVASHFEITNSFNNYFSNIALDIQSSIKYSAKVFHEFLPPLNIKSFFLSPTDKNKIISIISALDSQNASRPNSIPIKV